MYQGRIKYYIKHRTGRNSLYTGELLHGETKELIRKKADTKKREFSKKLGTELFFTISFRRVEKDVDSFQNHASNKESVSNEIRKIEIDTERDKIKFGIYDSVRDFKAKEVIDLLEKYKDDIDIFEHSTFFKNEERATVLKKYEQLKNNN